MGPVPSQQFVPSASLAKQHKHIHLCYAPPVNKKHHVVLPIPKASWQSLPASLSIILGEACHVGPLFILYILNILISKISWKVVMTLSRSLMSWVLTLVQRLGMICTIMSGKCVHARQGYQNWDWCTLFTFLLYVSRRQVAVIVDLPTNVSQRTKESTFSFQYLYYWGRTEQVLKLFFSTLIPARDELDRS